MSELKDIVPPLELCKKAEARFPEAWKHDFCRDEWHQTALCWRTFNRGRKDEYCIVFFTGSVEPKDGDVNAPTLEEIRRKLRNLSVNVIDGTITMSCRINPEDTIFETARDDNDVTAAALRLWLKVNGSSNE